MLRAANKITCGLTEIKRKKDAKMNLRHWIGDSI